MSPSFFVTQLKIENRNSLKSDRSAHYFHSISADTNICHLVAVPCCSNVDFTWSFDLDTLPNDDLLISFRDPMPHHPTGGTARGRSGSRIFTAVKKHASSDLKPIFMTLRAKKVKEARFGALEEFGRLRKTRLYIAQRLPIVKRDNRKR
jgi:hypothetical protein